MYEYMTFDEFIEALEKVDMPFDIWKFEGILNMLSIANRYTAEEDEKRGYKPIADAELEKANAIFDILDARGYYNRKSGGGN